MQKFREIDVTTAVANMVNVQAGVFDAKYGTQKTIRYTAQYLLELSIQTIRKILEYDGNDHCNIVLRHCEETVAAQQTHRKLPANLADALVPIVEIFLYLTESPQAQYGPKQEDLFETWKANRYAEIEKLQERV